MTYAFENREIKWVGWDMASGCYIVGNEMSTSASNQFIGNLSNLYKQIPTREHRCRFCDTLIFEGERRCVACGAPL